MFNCKLKEETKYDINQYSNTETPLSICTMSMANIIDSLSLGNNSNSSLGQAPRKQRPYKNRVKKPQSNQCQQSSHQIFSIISPLQKYDVIPFHTKKDSSSQHNNKYLLVKENPKQPTNPFIQGFFLKQKNKSDDYNKKMLSAMELHKTIIETPEMIIPKNDASLFNQISPDNLLFNKEYHYDYHPIYHSIDLQTFQHETNRITSMMQNRKKCIKKPYSENDLKLDGFYFNISPTKNDKDSRSNALHLNNKQNKEKMEKRKSNNRFKLEAIAYDILLQRKRTREPIINQKSGNKFVICLDELIKQSIIN